MTTAEKVLAKINTYPGTDAQKAAAFHAEWNVVDPPPPPMSLSAYAQTWATAWESQHGSDPLPWER